MKEVDYSSFGAFLRSSPRNLASIIVIWAIALVMIVVAIIQGPSTFDPEWSMYGMIVFLLMIMVLAYIRVYTYIYKKNKKRL